MTERRSSPRYRLIADIEVVELQSGRKVVSKTSDLSRYGCHVKTGEPFSEGSSVGLKITYGGCTFAGTAKVIYSVPQQAMGLAFKEFDSTASNTLENLLRAADTELRKAVAAEISGLTSRRRRFVLAFVVIAAGVVGAIIAARHFLHLT